MKKISLLTIMVYIGFIGYGQQETVDSLKKLIVHPVEDTVTATQYLLIAYNSYPDNDSLELYAKKALSLSQSLRWQRGIAKAKLLMAYSANYAKSLSLLFECLRTFEELKDTIALMDCSFQINLIYKYLEDYSKSAEYSRVTLQYAKLINDTAWIWSSLYNLGNAYAALESKDSALFYFQEAFRVVNLTQVPRQRGLVDYYLYSTNENLGWSLHGLGRAQQLLGQHDLALGYYYKGLHYALRQTNQILTSDLHNSIADCYMEMGYRDSALKYARTTLHESITIKYELNILASYTQLARLYEGLNNDSSVKYYKLAFEVRGKQFNAKNKTEVANVTFTEQERQKEILAQQERIRHDRSRNLQLASIGIGLITFLIIFLLLSQSIMVKSGLVKFLGVLALLLSFEFINLFIHPVIATVTNHSQVWMFIIMVCIAALLVPAHHRLEKWITHQLVEKNKRIRLAAAKKTIATLEG